MLKMLDLFLLTGIISFASISGIIFTNTTLNKFLNNNLHYLISFSAGVFLITAIFTIFEVITIIGSIWQSALMVIIGFIIAKLLIKILPETHHHHDKCCNGHKKNSGKKIIIGDSIHNIADGLLLSSSYFVSPKLVLPLFIAILIHEILQEISEFFVLIEAGYTKKTALLINFFSSLTIFIGIFIGIYLTDNTEIQAIILALSSGFFLNIVFEDLLPHQYKNYKKTFFKHLIILVIGIAVVLLAFSLFNH